MKRNIKNADCGLLASHRSTAQFPDGAADPEDGRIGQVVEQGQGQGGTGDAVRDRQGPLEPGPRLVGLDPVDRGVVVSPGGDFLLSQLPLHLIPAGAEGLGVYGDGEVLVGTAVVWGDLLPAVRARARGRGRAREMIGGRDGEAGV